jgi:hypothetical protein
MQQKILFALCSHHQKEVIWAMMMMATMLPMIMNIITWPCNFQNGHKNYKLNTRVQVFCKVPQDCTEQMYMYARISRSIGEAGNEEPLADNTQLERTPPPVASKPDYWMLATYQDKTRQDEERLCHTPDWHLTQQGIPGEEKVILPWRIRI